MLSSYFEKRIPMTNRANSKTCLTGRTAAAWPLIFHCLPHWRSAPARGLRYTQQMPSHPRLCFTYPHLSPRGLW